MFRFFRPRPHFPQEAAGFRGSKILGKAHLPRRCLAWGLEVAILAGSAALPTALGNAFYGQVSHQGRLSQAPALAPALAWSQFQVARWLGRSPRTLPRQAPLWIQGLWALGFLGPSCLAGVYLYTLHQRGRWGPKAWLGLSVTHFGPSPLGWGRVVRREVVGRWGLPLGLAYGLWRLSGTFPNPWAWATFTLGTVTALGSRALWHPQGRTWADELGGTWVVQASPGPEGEDPEIPVFFPRLMPSGHNRNGHSPGGQGWRWGALALGVAGVLGSAAWGGYGLWQQQRTATANQALFTAVVATLTNPEAGPEAQRTAILALGGISDPQVITFLVDLLAQGDSGEMVAALQQALVNQGIAALPVLGRLNQALTRELGNPGPGNTVTSLRERLRGVNWVVNQILAEADPAAIAWLDLSGLNFGAIAVSTGGFSLDLSGQTLAGSQWRGTVMNRAQFQQTQFFHPGGDLRVDTYDDRISDLRGADLTDSTLEGANLTLAQLQGASLLRANLAQAVMNQADLSRANLEGATLLQAQLRRAVLVQTRLIGADLTAVQLEGAQLTEAKLRRAKADGANLRQADLQRVEAQEIFLGAADLRGASLVGATLSGANLVGADLTGANLTGANLAGADLRQAILTEVVLSGANFAGVRLAPDPPELTEGFVAAAPTLDRGDRLAGVDFNGVRNLDGNQLAYICAQGGRHRACVPS